MSFFHRIKPEERILRCAGRRPSPSSNKLSKTIRCEKAAGHDWGCLLSVTQRLHVTGAQDSAGLIRLYQMEGYWHAGRDRSGKWYHWTRRDI
jgi:hypothetical protein